MASFLLKTEPTDFSFADLQRAKKTLWDGVANPVALKHLRGMQPGDQLIIYETGDQKSAVGTAKVLSVDPIDVRNPRVEIEAGKALAKPVPLSVIKANKVFADSPLVHQGRLSVVPLTPAQFKALTGE
jgi:predicted RNA-binding protein with PUA-like domain